MPSGSAFPRHLKDFACVLARPFYGGIGCIVALHRIVPEDRLSSLSENRALELTPGALRAVLDWTRRRGLEVIRMDEVKARLSDPRGGKFIVFTFDDGYRDNLTAALPIFRDFGYPLTVNLTTGFLDRTASVWWYALEDILALRADLQIEWQGQRRAWSWESPGERERVFADWAALIRAEDRAGRTALITALCQAAGLDPLASTGELMLDWAGAKELVAQWHVGIGAHSVSHCDLARLSADELEEELIESKAEIEARLGRPVKHFAYPFGGRGSVGRREFDLAREADYLTAVTTRSGNLFPEHAWHLQALPRLTLSGNYPPLTLLNRLESGLLTARANRWRRVIVD
jgi:peptidoglycan/xylan/chitin deacetylase (PgdA/CDA1 family)